jgi:hypothetical protein
MEIAEEAQKAAVEKQPEPIYVTEEEYEDMKAVEERELDESLKGNPVEIPATSDYCQDASIFLLRDLRIFKIELWLLIVPIITGVFIGLLSFLNVIPMVFNIASFAIMVLVAGGIFAFKKMNYMPNRKRRLVERIYQSGQVFITCEEIKDGKVKFGGTAEPSTVTNLVAHVEGYSGQPIVKCYEGHYENLNINKVMKGLINAKSSRFMNDAMDEAGNEGARLERLKNMIAGKDVNNTTLLMAIGLVLVVLVGYIWFFALPQADVLKAIQIGVEAIPAAIKANVPQIVNVGG